MNNLITYALYYVQLDELKKKLSMTLKQKSLNTLQQVIMKEPTTQVKLSSTFTQKHYNSRVSFQHNEKLSK